MTTSSRTALIAAGVAVLALASPTAPATSQQSAERSRPAPTTLFDVSDLETGAPPALAWSERRSGRTVIHGTTGTSTPAPNNLDAFVPMPSGFVVQTAGNRPVTTRWLSADGTLGTREWRTGYGLAVSAQGKAVGFAGKRGRVWTIDDDGYRVLSYRPVPITGTGHAVAVRGEDCKESDVSTGCSVYVNGARGWYTSSHGIVDRAPRMRLVSTGRGRWLGGITRISDTGTCSVMLRNGRARWRTCDNRFSDIAPDDAHVLGLPAYGDGFGPTTLDLLATADGSTVRTFRSPDHGAVTTYFDEVWEDAQHVLVVTYSDEEWAVVRLGVDGSMEYAVPPRRGSSDLRSPLQLQTR